jgi:hypothetical protein
MPKIKGFVERRHRPLIVCFVCGKDAVARCQDCKGEFCDEHLRFHSCHAVFEACIRRLEEEVDDLEADLDLERWESSLITSPFYSEALDHMLDTWAPEHFRMWEAEEAFGGMKCDD